MTVGEEFRREFADMTDRAIVESESVAIEKWWISKMREMLDRLTVEKRMDVFYNTAVEDVEILKDELRKEYGL